MSAETGPSGPQTSISEGTRAGGIDTEPSSAGCRYATPAGRCGDPGATYRLNGIEVVLCGDHLPAVLAENDLTREDAA